MNKWRSLLRFGISCCNIWFWRDYCHSTLCLIFVWPLLYLNKWWLWMINIAANFKPAHQLSINLLLAEFKVFCCKWAEKQKEDYLLGRVWLWTVCWVCQHHKIKPEAKRSGQEIRLSSYVVLTCMHSEVCGPHRQKVFGISTRTYKPGKVLLCDWVTIFPCQSDSIIKITHNEFVFITLLYKAFTLLFDFN